MSHLLGKQLGVLCFSVTPCLHFVVVEAEFFFWLIRLLTAVFVVQYGGCWLVDWLSMLCRAQHVAHGIGCRAYGLKICPVAVFCT